MTRRKSSVCRRQRPLLIVIAAPSGAGKSTLCRRLLADEPRMFYSVSCTTRPPRGSEKNGRDYHFLSVADFRRRLRQGRFLEHAMVHGHHYGTLRAPVLRALRQGRDVLMDIDVQGAAQVRRAARHGRNRLLRAALVDIFIAPPSLRELRRRLEQRHEDAPEVIRQRLRNARIEMACRREFRHVVVNDDLETAYRELRAILSAARHRAECGQRRTSKSHRPT